MLPSREAVIAVVDDWMAGKRTTREVHEWADQIVFDYRRPEGFVPGRPPNDLGVEEVVIRLSVLNEELLIAGDGPTIVAFLKAQPDDSGAWRRWRAFLQGLGDGNRRLLLRDDPYYNTQVPA